MQKYTQIIFITVPKLYCSFGMLVGAAKSVYIPQWTLCIKDRKYDKRHVWSKNHSGCLETSCHVRGPLRNKMATLEVIPSRSDIDPSADPVPDQTMLPTVSLTESDIPRAFLKSSILKGSQYVRLCQAYCWQHSWTRN